MAIKHKFISPKEDGADETLVRPSNWNDDHDYDAAVHEIPSGLIALWHGLLSNIPSGWVLCDGKNGTPNLLDKFVKSVPDDETDPGSGGGSNTHDHDTHTGAGGHTHSSAGGHTHDSHLKHHVGMGFDPVFYSPTTHNNEGSHTHDAISNHTHDAHSEENNIPVYYELAFIMKT